MGQSGTFAVSLDFLLYWLDIWFHFVGEGGVILLTGNDNDQIIVISRS